MRACFESAHDSGSQDTQEIDQILLFRLGIADVEATVVKVHQFTQVCGRAVHEFYGFYSASRREDWRRELFCI
jgi:hypothetical protein